MRLVLDTSVLVSAFRSNAGASFRLLELLYEEQFVAVATTALLLEYESVLKRPEQLSSIGISLDELEDAIRVIAGFVEPVQIDFQWRPQLRDANDELVLEAAINGHADAIVTHNVRDFDTVPEQFGILVVRPGSIIKRRVS